MRTLSTGGVSVQAPAEDRGPDASPAGLGSLPSHQEQRAGPQPPRESGEWPSIWESAGMLQRSGRSVGRGQ